MRVILVRDGRGRAVEPVRRLPKKPVRRARKNTIMMTIGQPNPRARRNCSPGCGCCSTNRVQQNRGNLKPKFKKYSVPLSKVKNSPLIQHACERYQRFQDAPATKVEVYEYDDGRPEIEERVCFKIGRADIKIDTVEDESGREIRIKPLEIGNVYMGEKNSPTKGGQQWIHSHREDGGVPPIKVVDVETGIMMDLGGTGYVDDWMRR